MKETKILLGGLVFLGTLLFNSPVFADEVNHTVTANETLSSISLQYFGDVNHIGQIAQDNNIVNQNLIFEGTELKINTDASVNETAAPVNTTSAQTNEAANYSGRTLTMESTAYSIDARDTSTPGTITATGQNLVTNPMAIAVDPSVIPLGTRVYVEGYGEAVASDTGGAIKGNKIDVHFLSYDQAIAWGRRTVQVTILD